MKFGRMPVVAGEGAILAHAVKAAGVALKKGDVIRTSDVVALRAAGIETVIAARLESGDVGENLAASMLAERVAGANVRLERPFTGRCNLLAETSGLVRIDADVIDAINAQDEAITVATLFSMQPVVADEMIATVKIIPFAVPGANLARAIEAAGSAPVSVAPFLPLRVGVVSTLLPGLKASTVDKTLQILDERLAVARASIVSDMRVAHDTLTLGPALGSLGPVDLVVVFGASAITDRRDVVPAAVESAGGVVEHLGMPVDPGNLLLLGRIGANGRNVPLIGAPGCARSAKENGFDFVLWRLLAGQPVTGADLRRMGVGGLLSEIVSRPQRRQIAATDARATRPRSAPEYFSGDAVVQRDR